MYFLNIVMLHDVIYIQNTGFYNPVLVYCRELAPSTVSLTGDRAQGDDSKHDSHYSTPWLFILQFISNKTKVLTLLWDKRYHNTSIYHINKKNCNTTLQITNLATFKSPYPTSTCVNFLQKKVYMPTVQFAEVPNKSFISNNCFAFAIMFI